MLDGAKNKWFHKNVRFQKNHLKQTKKSPLTRGLNIVKIKSPVRGLLFFYVPTGRSANFRVPTGRSVILTSDDS